MFAENIPGSAINFVGGTISNFLYPATILSYNGFLNLGSACFLITFARSNLSLHDVKPGAVRPRLYRN
jgi:hypothetical protein